MRAQSSNVTALLNSILSTGSDPTDAAAQLEKGEKSFNSLVSDLGGSAPAQASAAVVVSAKPASTDATATNDNAVSMQHPALRAYRDSDAA